jgi:transposase InsO family protein
VYLAVVIDAWSRRVIGWSIADHPRTELVVDALDIDRKTWTTRRELAQGIFEYIEAFYNPERRHTKINYLSPIEYETRHRPVGAVA